MNRTLLLTAVLLCGCLAVAQENGIPGWPGLPSHYLVTQVDTAFVGGFSPGGSDDWPKASVTKFDGIIIRSFSQANVLIVLQGTADAMDWEQRKRKEDHRLDVGVADSRATLGYTRVKRLGANATVLPSLVNYPGRGMLVYLVHYQAPPQASIEQDDCEDCCEPQAPSTATVRLGFALGGTYLRTSGMDFAVPMASVVLKFEPATYLVVSGGFWSHTVSGSAFPERSEVMVAAEVAHFPSNGALGYAAGLRGAWENNLSQDKYLERTYGLALGPRLRFGHLQLGLDAQLSNIDRMVGKSTWGVGIAATVRFVYLP